MQIRQGEVRFVPVQSFGAHEARPLAPQEGVFVVGESESHHHHVIDAEGVMVAQAAHIPVHLGAMPSAASACSVRGATRIDPTAEESVAQASPIGTIGPQTAICDMTRGSEASRPAGAELASFQITAT